MSVALATTLLFAITASLIVDVIEELGSHAPGQLYSLRTGGWGLTAVVAVASAVANIVPNTRKPLHLLGIVGFVTTIVVLQYKVNESVFVTAIRQCAQAALGIAAVHSAAFFVFRGAVRVIDDVPLFDDNNTEATHLHERAGDDRSTRLWTPDIVSMR